MKKDETYNGWTNYETWCAGLWLDNDETRYKTLVNKVRFVDETDDDDVEDFQDFLKAAVNHMTFNDLHCDLKPSDIEKVNFEELTTSWLELDFS